jgi:hypothetical protein
MGIGAWLALVGDFVDGHSFLKPDTAPESERQSHYAGARDAASAPRLPQPEMKPGTLFR